FFPIHLGDGKGPSPPRAVLLAEGFPAKDVGELAREGLPRHSGLFHRQPKEGPSDVSVLQDLRQSRFHRWVAPSRYSCKARTPPLGSGESTATKALAVSREVSMGIPASTAALRMRKDRKSTR